MALKILQNMMSATRRRVWEIDDPLGGNPWGTRLAEIYSGLVDAVAGKSDRSGRPLVFASQSPHRGLGGDRGSDKVLTEVDRVLGQGPKRITDTNSTARHGAQNGNLQATSSTLKRWARHRLCYSV